ncbi:microtubule-associated protein RP/EB family member 2 [Octopus bimaculoides]|uniref:Calponin-homology (CH) domain-containing protein n=1 Tax=Octopus bimaculoides TaxID=37653 RepID=A0A0L8FR80_OCTBM|nr:microtubule-associated protein RP/EB family member 2 [Octopus bimaculoides]|eukprot:XP_014787826.1 PREDICTED: microtubule-associated protein RP/EB family member 2-like [Octopus bimaculoides]
MAVTHFHVKDISKNELLNWFRKYLSPDIQNIEELATGADFCLGMEILFPGSIDIRKVKFVDACEYFRRMNFKQFRTALNSINLKKDIPIDDLIKGTFKHNFFFGLWFKAFFDANYNSQPYDILQLRAQYCKKKTLIKNIGDTSKSGTPTPEVDKDSPEPEAIIEAQLMNMEQDMKCKNHTTNTEIKTDKKDAPKMPVDSDEISSAMTANDNNYFKSITTALEQNNISLEHDNMQLKYSLETVTKRNILLSEAMKKIESACFPVANVLDTTDYLTPKLIQTLKVFYEEIVEILKDTNEKF